MGWATYLNEPPPNEQRPPIEVETQGRPRHPEPSSIKGEGWTKEVAVGTVIQDLPQSNHGSQPRWDRCARADLFAPYRAWRTQGLSERQAAQELQVPRTTLHAWRRWHDSLAICPQVADFLQSGPGLAF
jgi:hypothetical protein